MSPLEESVAVHCPDQTPLAAEFTYKDTPLFSEAAPSRNLFRIVPESDADEVQVVFTNFISTLNQKPEVMQFLP